MVIITRQLLYNVYKEYYSTITTLKLNYAYQSKIIKIFLNSKYIQKQIKIKILPMAGMGNLK